MFVDPYQIRRAIRDGISITAGGAVQLSAGTTSSARSDFTFSNGSGVSFGLNGVGVITASVAPAAGGLTNIKVSAGILSELRSDITFSNANGVTFGLAAGGVITASVAPGGAQSTQPVAASASNGSFLFSTVGFSNANGVTFGTSAGNIITASVQTDYQSTGAYLTTAQPPGAYLTTAQPPGVYAGTGFTSTTTAGTAIVATLNTSGLSMGIPAYLTTAAAAGLSAINISAGTTSTNASAFTFSNSNNFTFGLGTGASVGRITASYSNDRAGTNTSVVTTAGSDLSFAVNTSGVTIAYPKWLTAAAGGAGGVAISNSQSLFSTGTVGFSAGGGAITIAGSTSAGGQSLMFSVPQTSSVVGSGMISIGTAGSTINISAPNTSSLSAVGLVTVSITGSTIAIAVPNTSALVGSGGVSISTTGSTIAIYGVGAGTVTSTATIAGQNITLGADNAGITIGYPLFGTTAGAAVLSYYANLPFFPSNTTVVTASNSVLAVIPFTLPQAVSGHFMRFAGSMSFSNGTVAGTSVNTSFTVNKTHTVALAILTQMTGANSINLGYSTSTFGSFIFQTSITAGATGSHFTVQVNATYPQLGTYVNNFQTSVATTAASWSIPAGVATSISGSRWIDIPFDLSLSPGNYWMAIGGSTNTAGNAATNLGSLGLIAFSSYAHSQTALTFAFIGSASASSVQNPPGLGSWSTNAALMSTSSIAVDYISMQAAQPIPYFQIIRSA